MRTVERIGIIGTGTMGKQLAQFIAEHGFEVDLKSRTVESLEKAVEKIKDKTLKHINLTTRFDELSGADIIIECIIENREAKRQLFKKLDGLPKDIILATNTSSLSINDFLPIVSDPRNVIGIHFFNPVRKMSLVEIIKGVDTSKRTLERTVDFVRRLDKTPIIIDDSPGFIVNRLLFTMINEAGYLLMENIASVQEIDISMKLGTAHPLGPFELADYIGIDVTYEIIKNLSLSLQTFKSPAKVFKKMIETGKLGRKTKRGFYEYNKE